MASSQPDIVTNAYKGAMQAFDSGATRSSSEGKNDYEGFLSFRALEAYGDYMRRHQITADGSQRASDNWKQGIPLSSYLKSLVRHVLELAGLYSGYVSKRLRAEYPLRAHDHVFLIEETACAILFNVQGFLHEWTKGETQFHAKQNKEPLPFIGGGAGLPSADRNQWNVGSLPQNNSALPDSGQLRSQRG